MLIGVLSKTPTEEQLANSAEKDWFGSPPIGLPSRQKSDIFNDHLTYNPPASLKFARAIVEGIKNYSATNHYHYMRCTFIAYTSIYLEGRIPLLLALSHSIILESFAFALSSLQFYLNGFL